MKTILFLPVFALALIISCGVTEQEPLEKPKVEEYFRAEINGILWTAAHPNAAFTIIGTDTLFQVFVQEYDTLRWPYNEAISLSVDFNSHINEYPIIPTRMNMNEWRIVGGRFAEIDGDATIANYNPIEDSLNYLNLRIAEENELSITIGSFAMKVVVDPSYNSEHNNKYRQHPDTVYITKGEFKVVIKNPLTN